MFVGPGTRSSTVSKPAHVSCFIWGDLRDKTIYWLSNRIPAVDLPSLTFHLPSCPFYLSLFLSLTLSNSVPLPAPLFPSLACLQVVCCSQCGAWVQTLQPSAAHETVLLGIFQKCGTTKLSHQGDSILSICFSLLAASLSITGVRSSSCYGVLFSPEVSFKNSVCSVCGVISVYSLNQS